MTPFYTRLLGAVVALTLAAGGPALSQQLELKLMAPAAPGGGWDQTARAMQQARISPSSSLPRVPTQNRLLRDIPPRPWSGGSSEPARLPRIW